MKNKILIAIAGFALVIAGVFLGLFHPGSDEKSPAQQPILFDPASGQSETDDADEAEDVTYYEGHDDGSVMYMPSGWTAGEGTELKKSQVHFLAKDYMNAQYAYNAAYEYGLSSAGEFAIHDHYDLHTEEWIGYTVVIRDKQSE